VVPVERWDGNPDCRYVCVVNSDWVNVTDEYGTASIPLTQTVTIVTSHTRVVLTFSSQWADYNRLIFPHQDVLFSDFEGMLFTVCRLIVMLCELVLCGRFLC